MVAALGVVAAIGFVAGYRADVTDPPRFDQAAFEQMLDSPGFTIDGVPPEDLAAIRQQMIDDSRASAEQELAARNQQQLTDLQKYAFPQSVATIVGFGIAPIVVLILMMAIVLGDEFRFGTIRTSFLAANDRRRFLATRLLVFGALAVAVFLALTLLSGVLSLLLLVTGSELAPATIALAPASLLAMVVTEVGVIVVGIVLAALVTLIVRSSLSFLLIAVWLAIEAAITALPIFQPDEPLGAFRQLFLTSEIRTLLARLATESHAVAFADVTAPDATISSGPAMEVAVIVAWGLLFLALADRRIRRMDIVE